MIAVLRAPALHFLVIGGLLFLASSLRAAPKPTLLREPVVISAARVEEIREDYRRTLGALPTSRELDALIEKEAEDEMLYREALLLGLDRGDPAVEWRVIEKMEFLYGERPGGQVEALRRGLELGLQRDDVVVRSGLVTKMRLLAKGASRVDEPRGAELERELGAYLERHGDDYVRPGLWTFTHVFLAGSAGREAEATALRARLITQATLPGDAPKHGDPFVAGGELRATTEAGMTKVFGEDFARTVTALEPLTWSEPIRSPYGVHLVWVAEKVAPRMAALEEVRSQVLHAYRAERQREYLETLIAGVRNAYEVRLEQGARQGAIKGG